MGTSAAFACFASVLLAMNFATYFAEEKQTFSDEDLKPFCENKTIEAMDSCYKEKATPLMKELFSLCAKKVGIKGDFSFKLLFEVSCVKGGAKTYTQFHDCGSKEKSKRKISEETWVKNEEPFSDCVDEKLTPKPK